MNTTNNFDTVNDNVDDNVDDNVGTGDQLVPRKIRNKNKNQLCDFIYLVMDHPTNAVMASSTSYEAAQAIQLFSSRLQIRAVETHKPWLDDNFKITNFNNTKRHHTVVFKNNNRVVETLSPKVATNEFVKRRREIISRLKFHDSLSTKVNLLMAGTGYPKIFLDYADTIGYELQQCRPNEEYYTYAIQAYSIASECDTASAYNELKLQLDNLAHLRMRSLGIYIKYRNKLNDAPGDRDSQRAVIQESMQELQKNSFV
jgi:hypothetical protein